MRDAVNTKLERSKVLKQALLNFVLNAKGDLATALETFSAEQSQLWAQGNLQGISRLDLALDMFATVGQVAQQSVLSLFIQAQSNLSLEDQALVASWQRTFNGLFVVLQSSPKQPDPERYEVMNWLTEKCYQVRPNGLQAQETLARLKPGEMMMTRLAPVTEDYWTFSGPVLVLGKLGRPKLAVAIGNFKTWFPQHLYGDAPELLEVAWESVQDYHQEFVEFFGSDQVTLPGHTLNQKLQEYQEITTQRRLQAAGLDSSKSLRDLAEEAGVSVGELEESVADLGAEGKAVKHMLTHPKAIKMMVPSIKLPDDLRQAEAVTVFVHPRWGQTFLNDYTRLTGLLDLVAPEDLEALDRLLLKYLKTDRVNRYIWQCLASAYPQSLEASLRRVLHDSTWQLASDLDAVLTQFGKPLQPPLPETASVPIHLHHLFQEALQDVHPSASKKTSTKQKSQGKRKQKAGFGV